MPRDSILLDLLRKPDWEQFQPLVDRLQRWIFYPLFLRAVEDLNLSVLYESDIHGIGHIERTICHGAMCAMEERLDEADTSLLLDACSYHDIGRSRDGLDFTHGAVAARFIGLVTGRHRRGSADPSGRCGGPLPEGEGAARHPGTVSPPEHGPGPDHRPVAEGFRWPGPGCGSGT